MTIKDNWNTKPILFGGLPGDFYLNDGRHLSVDDDGCCFYVIVGASGVADVLSFEQAQELVQTIGAETWDFETHTFVPINL